MKLFVPSLDRQRKRAIDKLFMDYKSEVDNKFRYVVKIATMI